MTCTCAPALLTLRAEFDAMWPNRDKASDGCCGDAAHAARKSDHNPDASGYAHALDVDQDLRGTTDIDEVVEWMWNHPDPRVKYFIRNRKLIYVNDGARPRGIYPYSGINPHLQHLHISIVSDATFDTTPWLTGFAGAVPVEPPPVVVPAPPKPPRRLPLVIRAA